MKPCNPTLGREIRTAWLEYEIGKTAEARWVQEMDKLECLIQAHEHEQRTFGEKDLEEFQGLIKISSPEGKSLQTCCRRRDKSISRSENGEFVFSSSSVYLCPASGVDCNTGPPRIDMKTQSALLCQEFEFQHISLDESCVKSLMIKRTSTQPS